jgi:mono/diheme cytochrome c family protein
MEVKGSTYKGAMPAWNTLSDDELAAVMSYLRSEWGNQAPAVQSDTVKAQREATKARTEPYKGGQELKSGG